MTTSAGIITYSGRFVEVGPTGEVPTLADIALALSRLPRFAGHTRRWWSVLDHSLYCYHLALDYSYAMGLSGFGRRSLTMAALLHDAHEAVTADVPSPFKPMTMKAHQVALDVRIMDVLYPGGHLSFATWHNIVAMLDRRALLAEALVIGPPAVNRSVLVEKFGADAQQDDQKLLLDLLDDGVLGVEQIARGMRAKMVTDFLTLAQSLI